MLLGLLAITAALFLITSSNALSVETLHDLARHHHIAARHPAVKRASVSARCKKSNYTSSAAASSTWLPTSTAPPAPPAPSTSQAPPPPSSHASGKGKVGIAWANGDAPYLKNFITEKVSTIYNWSPDKPQDTFGLEFVPMLWGYNQIADFQNVVKPGYAKIALGFNEPDIADRQANIDPVAAAQLWMTNIQPLKDQGYQLITPAVAFKADWLQTFFGACKGCTFDHMAAHVYHTNPQDVIDYLTGLHNMFGMSIWVTEFACQSFISDQQCDEDQVFTFMTTLIQWMDNTAWIDKYFYFGMMNAGQIADKIQAVNALINDDGTPNKLGRIYIGL